VFSSVSVTTASVILILFAFGAAKAALMPVHAWLPAAMVAPTPVSALLHAVAVVKAGVFVMLKVSIYVFGPDLMQILPAAKGLAAVAGASIVIASLIAMTKDNLKARLAYSTISQLAYIVLGALLANEAGFLGGGLHIATHAFGKITLFFCAGAIYVAAHKTEVSELDGIGRAMPVTMFAFLVASLSIIGLPPLGGTWSKWYLALGAIDAGYAFIIAVLMLSSLLNIAYLLSIVARGFFRPSPGQTFRDSAVIREAPLACLVALCTTAALCVGLFFFAGEIERLVAQVLPHAASSGSASR
jgi:multicomponent Na+:H+ antiporter subunit D